MYAQDARNRFAGSAIEGGMGVLAAAETAQRMPEVAAEMSRLETAVDTLHKTASVLFDRLGSVRSQCGTLTGKDEAASPEPVLCGYASAIRAQRQKAESAQAILQRALNELEI